MISDFMIYFTPIYNLLLTGRFNSVYKTEKKGFIETF